jgi:septal ring-binding cell division protein DamX
MSQKTNSMIKLALVFFIALLSFSVGTYVGKKYSDNQHKLAQLEPNKKEGHETPDTKSEFATHSDTHAVAKSEGESQALTDSEVAKIAEEFATEQPTTAAHDATTNHETVAEEKPIQTIQNTAELDEKEIKTIAPQKKTVAKTQKALPAKVMPAKTLTQAAAENVEKIQNDREPSSIRPQKEITPSMHFTVQIGSFPTEPEAVKMTKDLQSKGYKTSYVAALVNGQTWYRVNVGLFGSVKEAQEYKTDFLDKTKLTTAIVQKIQ